MFVRRSARLAFLALVIVMALQGSCSSDAHAPARLSPGDPQLTNWLLEIDSASVPAAVDAELFAQLKAELRRILLARATDKAPIGESNMAQDLCLGGSDSAGWTLSWSYLNTGDYNLDSQVTVADLTPIGIYFGRQAGEEGWLEASVADGDGNQRITVADLTPIGLNFRATVGGFNVYGGDTNEGPWNMVGAAALPDLKATTEISFALAARDYEFYCIAPIDLQDAVGVMSPPSMAQPGSVLAEVSSVTPWQEASIGPAGGSLSGPGVGSGPISAVIPPGALSENTLVSLGVATGSASLDGVELPGSFIYLSADPPLELAQAAQVTVPFAADPNTIFLPFTVTHQGGLLPLEISSEDSDSLSFEMWTLYPKPLQPTASADPGIVNTLIGIGFLVGCNLAAERESVQYAFHTGFNTEYDAFTYENSKLSNVLMYGQEAFAAWYFKNYSQSMGRLTTRFIDLTVLRRIASRAQASVMARFSDNLDPDNLPSTDPERSFEQVKTAMRLSGPVMVYAKQGSEFLRPFLAYGYRGGELMLYDADRPSGRFSFYPLHAGNAVRLIGSGSLATFESFENILLDATANPPFGDSDEATITITSHQPGDIVEESSATLSGYVTSSYALVTSLIFWNTRQPKEEMLFVEVPETGEFQFELPLLEGVNSFVVLTTALLLDPNYGTPYQGTVGSNLEDQSFWLEQKTVPLPEGWLRFTVDWESFFASTPCLATDLHQPYLSIYRPGIGATSVYYAAPGNLDSEPFALWEDNTAYSNGEAYSGRYVFTVSQVGDGSYAVRMDTANAAYNLHRITHISVDGVVSGSFTMEDGHAGPNTAYIGVEYDASTGELTKRDISYPVSY